MTNYEAIVLVLVALSLQLKGFHGGHIGTFIWNINPVVRFFGLFEKDYKWLCWHKYHEKRQGIVLRCEKCGHEYVTSLAEC